MPDQNDTSGSTLQAYVLRVLNKYDDETGFVILKCSDKEGKIHSVKGHYHEDPTGQDIIAHGSFAVHETYGPQFNAVYIEPAKLIDPNRIAAYLASLGIPGIGPVVARNITLHFGRSVFDVIDNDPDRLTEVARVPEKAVTFLKKSWEGVAANRDLVMFLMDLSIPARHIPEIRERLGPGAATIIRMDPYVLSRKISGFGFEKADAIAMGFGIDKHDPKRKRAVIDDVLHKGMRNGECGQPRNIVIEMASEKLRLPPADIIAFLEKSISQRSFICEEIDETLVIYLPNIIAKETRIARNLLDMVGKKPCWGDIDVDRALEAQTKPGEHLLGTDQTLAVEAILENRLTIMTGGPGVGKTHTLKTALDVLQARGVTVALCAPTGMAAKKMREATGRAATTIHTMLGVDGETGGFQHDADHPVHADIIVVDEFSMADIHLADSLIEAVGWNCSLLIVGDVDQLPSVGPGRVLHDIISSGLLPVARLNQVHRQSEDSLIIDASHAINRGAMPPEAPDHLSPGECDYLFISKDSSKSTQETILALVCEGLKRHSLIDEETYDPIKDVMVVAAQKKGDAGVIALNQKLRSRLNPLPDKGSLDRIDVVDRYGDIQASFGMKDKVMNTVNRTKKGIVNGDVGYISQIDPLDGNVWVDFDCGTVELKKSEVRDLQLAYAITVHKSQGSEAKVLIMPVVEDFRHMLQRNLIYTGLTRARTLGIMVGQESALERAVDNIGNHQRWSFTGEALRRAGAVKLDRDNDPVEEPDYEVF